MSRALRKAWRALGALILLAGAPSLAQATAQVIAVRLVMTDVQGTPVMKKDLQGNILARYDYRPYGAQQSGPVEAGPGYTGHVNDPQTGLVYMQQRYYDPEVGRFLSVDPVGVAVGNLYNLNRYTYANNNPIVNIDPTGMKPGDLFATPSEAAIDALTFINPTSISENREYAGYVIMRNNMYMATTPVAGEYNTVVGDTNLKDPIYADYHTHGDYSVKRGRLVVRTSNRNRDGFDSDHFSRDDLDRAKRYFGSGWRSYLGTPSGRYYVTDGTKAGTYEVYVTYLTESDSDSCGAACQRATEERRRRREMHPERYKNRGQR